ncbi:hypothetical protein J6590_006766 [Homalodisca vitripennis]|nr:hypothetical protein J6590_006766 [Homalodisca vitripennis]
MVNGLIPKRLGVTTVDYSDLLEQLIDSLKDWYPWVEFELNESLKNVSSKKASWVEAVVENLIPALPRRNVSRTVLLNQTRAELRQLQKGHYVVLIGMSGCGKSTLASEALNHDLLIENFEGKVIWLSCGPEAYTGDENELLGLMIQLNERICNEDLPNQTRQIGLEKSCVGGISTSTLQSGPYIQQLPLVSSNEDLVCDSALWRRLRTAGVRVPIVRVSIVRGSVKSEPTNVKK